MALANGGTALVLDGGALGTQAAGGGVSPGSFGVPPTVTALFDAVGVDKNGEVAS